MTYLEYKSPCGTLLLAVDSAKLCLCDWMTGPRHQHHLKRLHSLGTVNDSNDHSVLQRAVNQLDEYFAGKREEFDMVLAPSGSDFQQSVWQAIAEVPYGCVISYKALACRVGNEKAVRAVAVATASNPISLFIPCHRIVGSQGRLTGYEGGLPAKQYLLTLEHK